MTLGQKISNLRKKMGMTQEELAQKLNVSSQAVSKWENDLSIADISVLIEMSELFNVSLDNLLKDKQEETSLVKEELRKPLEKMVLRIVVNSAEGDKVRVNLPMPLVKMGLSMGMNFGDVANNENINQIDFEQIFKLVEEGVIGKLVEIESSDGDVVEIYVE